MPFSLYIALEILVDLGKLFCAAIAKGFAECKQGLQDSFARLLCWLVGHPGPIWYNPSRLGPDMHCRRCWKNLDDK